ncbi:MAG: hypothetical protein FI713_08330 [SAR202 cluster bacterium]|nr:hypothetical protein [SAR202 cluster bacterium]HAE32836.1 hypothetical protein [Dehalococcoidia bacterium]|tara:strand:+ start:110 stop:442 length:333 start_codon:yes stop_codon:yes gene_type:complete
MYKIRRVYRSKAGEAANLARLVYEQAKIYRDSGHRGEFTVSYNGYTLPGEQNMVILEWQDDKIMSPMRTGNNRPFEGIEAGLKFRPLIESQHIEFFEMIDPATMGDSCFI